MTRLLAIMAATASLVAAVAQGAAAGNYPSPTLAAAATSITGRPTSVWCETSPSAWQSYLPPGVDAAGFWTPAIPDQVQLAPDVCATLVGYLNVRRVDEVGIYNMAAALFTLAHEAEHARMYGGDEGVADCTAMPLVPGLATSFFGFPQTVQQTTYRPATRTVKVRVRGRTYRRTVPTLVAVTETVPNPDLARITAWLMPIHRAKPAAYQGSC